MPQLEYSVNNKPFTTTTTTDEDSDVEYSEHPFNSNTSKTNDSSNGNNIVRCFICTRGFTKAGSLKPHLDWHNDFSKQEALSDSSEDVPILSSDEESVTELHHSIGGKIVVSSPIKELTLKDYSYVYGKDFMAENQNYVTTFLTELHQRKNKFENRVHVMRFTSLNQNIEKSIE